MDIRWTARDGTTGTTDLFGMFALLSDNAIDSFPALRAHQRQPLHAFCCQVAALALLQAGRDALPRRAEDWRELLHGLTPDHPDGEPWRLVVDDWSRPALLQAPGIDPALREQPKKLARTPDALDMLRTGRNHDLKARRMHGATDDDWLFALISLQTQDGLEGPGLGGISRMNSAYGARVGVGLRPEGESPGAAFARDVRQLIARRSEAAADAVASDGEIGLVWLLPWRGTEPSVPLAQLDPYYVEICRLCRLRRRPNGQLDAVLSTAKLPRLAGKPFKGRTGDPWAPVNADEEKSWGVSAAGFGYRQLTTLLSPQDVRLPVLARADESDGRSGLVLHASAVTRGRGITEGFHERIVPIPPKAARRFDRAAVRDRVAEVARARRQAAAAAQSILRHALFVLHQGGPDRESLVTDHKPTEARIQRWMRSFDTRVDGVFFSALFWEETTAEGPQERIRERFGRLWRQELRAICRAVLDEAIAAAPRTTTKELRARARTENLFGGRMHRFVDPEPSPVQEASVSTEAEESIRQR